MGTIDISYFNLLIGLLLLVIPLFYLWKFKTGLLKATLIGTARMIVQLFLIGMYLKYLFLWNNPWINFLWVIIMFVAGQTALVRTGLKREILLIPISVGFLCSVVLVGMYFIGIVLQLDNVFSAQYFIPIFGILMGNMLSSNVIALNTYYSGLKREQQLYCYLLGNGATRQEAQAPFIREPTDCQYRGYGISSTSRHDDRANFGRQQSERCHKISNDDYGHYFHSLYVIINDHHLAGIP
jgi:putative ABC transport system permease protein